MMKQIMVKELNEYDINELFHDDYSLKLVEELESKNADIKKQLGLRSDAIVLYKKNRKMKVKFSGISGIISTSNYEIEIMPKCFEDDTSWRESLFYMIYIGQNNRIRGQKSNHIANERMNFFDHVAMIFLEEIEPALKKEQIHSYQTFKENSRFLRGKIMFNAQVKNVLVHPGVAYYENDVFDCENQFNYLLSWCCETLLVKIRNIRLRQRLKEVIQQIPRTKNTYLLPVEAKLSPQYSYFLGAVQIANSLALGFSKIHKKSGSVGYGYVVAMEVIYEKFIEKVLASLKDELVSIRTEAQTSILFAKTSDKAMRSYYTVPDNKMYINGVATLLIDAKYKNNFVEGHSKKPVNSDVYQLFSSLVAHECRRGILISPHTGSEGLVDKHWEIDNNGKKYSICSLSINVSDISTIDKMNKLKETLLYFIKKEIEIKVES